MAEGGLPKDDPVPSTSTSSTCRPRGMQNSPPTPKWAKWSTLKDLLDDSTGCELFETYLEQENCSQQLDFFFAVQGLKSSAEDDPKINQMIRTIYRHFIQNKNLLGLQDATKMEILQQKNAFKVDIFNKAQDEIFIHMNNHLYPNFLKSELYLSNVSFTENDEEVVGKAKQGEEENEFFQPTTSLQTINEDSVVGSFKLTKETLLKTQKLRSKAAKSEVKLASSSSSGRNPYHAAYNQYNPVSRQTSRQDSEVQSLSSDALTDDDLDRRRLRNASYNKDNLPLYPYHMQSRGPRPPMDEKIFAAKLIKKLDDYVKIKKFEEKFNKKILECEQSNLPRLLAAAIKEKLHVQQPEPDDSILDNHLSRIWNEDTHIDKSRSPPNSNNRLSRRVPNILPRRKEKDQISYYSADSGNIHDYRSKSLDRLTTDSLKCLKKKKTNTIEMISDSGVSVLSGAMPSCSSNNNITPVPNPNSLDRVHQWVEQISEEKKKISPNASRRMKKQQQYFQQLQHQIDENKKKSYKIPTFIYYEGLEPPYSIHIPSFSGQSINLIQFKDHMPKKGDHFRYYFYSNCPELGKDSHVLEEITEDHQILPIFQGKIIAHLRET